MASFFNPIKNQCQSEPWIQIPDYDPKRSLEDLPVLTEIDLNHDGQTNELDLKLLALKGHQFKLVTEGSHQSLAALGDDLDDIKGSDYKFEAIERLDPFSLDLVFRTDEIKKFTDAQHKRGVRFSAVQFRFSDNEFRPVFYFNTHKTIPNQDQNLTFSSQTISLSHAQVDEIINRGHLIFDESLKYRGADLRSNREGFHLYAVRQSETSLSHLIDIISSSTCSFTQVQREALIIDLNKLREPDWMKENKELAYWATGALILSTAIGLISLLINLNNRGGPPQGPLISVDDLVRSLRETPSSDSDTTDPRFSPLLISAALMIEETARRVHRPPQSSVELRDTSENQDLYFPALGILSAFLLRNGRQSLAGLASRASSASLLGATPATPSVLVLPKTLIRYINRQEPDEKWLMQ